MNIRKAAGAIVFQNDEYLLIHKVKSITENCYIKGQWDFLKGGIEEGEELDKAVLRELKEETGSSAYKIIKQFNNKICFDFPQGHKYNKQETVIFYVEYIGDRLELEPQDDEIDEIKFFHKDNILEVISLDETKNYFKELMESGEI